MTIFIKCVQAPNPEASEPVNFFVYVNFFFCRLYNTIDDFIKENTYYYGKGMHSFIINLNFKNIKK